jgi:hypothetical protein
MKTVKTENLLDDALDWAVALCNNINLSDPYNNKWEFSCSLLADYSPSYYWDQAGPIIERERIFIKPCTSSNLWRSYIMSKTGEGVSHSCIGERPLIAAMRCYVHSKLGDEVEIPEGL